VRPTDLDVASTALKRLSAGRTDFLPPALAGATVGIAMGATGSDAAIESADVAFTGHDLGLIPQALRHARRSGRIINQNIVLSLAIITVLLPLAITGVLGLAAGAPATGAPRCGAGAKEARRPVRATSSRQATSRSQARHTVTWASSADSSDDESARRATSAADRAMGVVAVAGQRQQRY